MPGKFIVIYGINNLGKSTQAKLLVERIKKQASHTVAEREVPAEYVKYPIYDLEPTGPMINAYLRKGNPDGLSPREFQMLHAQNRTHFEKFLLAKLDRYHVVAEDYLGTSIAWGAGAGVDRNLLKSLNSHLLSPDIAFLFDGTRFSDGIERGHAHESNDDLTERVRLVHLELAVEFGWHIIDANRPIEVIHGEIWSKTKTLFGLLADDFVDSAGRR
ncbi:MAG: hypothetical protein AAB617_01860 [Patescibacteria group bacterium]